MAHGPQPERSAAESAGALRLLIVDDQPEIYDYVRHALMAGESTPPSLHYAPSGEAARVHVEAESLLGRRYDVALIDMMMPGWDGMRTANELRAIDPRLPVILSSGVQMGNLPEIDGDIVRQNQYYILQKPYLARELRQLVRLCATESSTKMRAAADPAAGGAGAELPRTRLMRALGELTQKGGEPQHALLSIGIDRLRNGVAADSPERANLYARQVAAVLAKRIGARAHQLFVLDLDELAILLPDCGEAEALTMAETLAATDGIDSRGSRAAACRTSLSIGVVSFAPTGCGIAEILLTAEFARLGAETAGGGVQRAAVHDTGVVRIVRQNQVVPEIEWALAHEGFELWAQPIVPLRGSADARASIELLLRMHGKSGKLRTPDYFLPAVERHGLILNIDRFVVAKAIALLRDGSIGEEIEHLSVNVSPHLLNDTAGLAWLEQALMASGRARERLCIEITENAALRRIGIVSEFVHKMADQGVRFALDDFGAGFSTFDYLQSLPVFYLKVDGSLVRGCAADPRRLDLLRRIGDIGHAWGKHTIAEQVEDIETLEAITALGFDAAQGYLLARPATIGEAIRQAGMVLQRVSIAPFGTSAMTHERTSVASA